MEAFQLVIVKNIALYLDCVRLLTDLRKEGRSANSSETVIIDIAKQLNPKLCSVLNGFATLGHSMTLDALLYCIKNQMEWNLFVTKVEESTDPGLSLGVPRQVPGQSAEAIPWILRSHLFKLRRNKDTTLLIIDIAHILLPISGGRSEQ